MCQNLQRFEAFWQCLWPTDDSERSLARPARDLSVGFRIINLGRGQSFTTLAVLGSACALSATLAYRSADRRGLLVGSLAGALTFAAIPTIQLPTAGRSLDLRAGTFLTLGIVALLPSSLASATGYLLSRRRGNPSRPKSD